MKGNPNSMKKEMNSSYDNGRSVDPCYYNSSIYYGGQEIYSPSNCNTPPQNVSLYIDWSIKYREISNLLF